MIPRRHGTTDLTTTTVVRCVTVAPVEFALFVRLHHLAVIAALPEIMEEDGRHIHGIFGGGSSSSSSRIIAEESP
jgi:hypothetical protein